MNLIGRRMDGRSHNPLPPEIPTVTSGFDLLGSPIGPRFQCEASMLKRVKKVQSILERLPDLEDAQMETTILRFCLALPKVSFTLRSCPPHLVTDATSAFDSLMRESLSDLAGGPLPDWAWLKTPLPASLGGLGVRHAFLHAPAAYISSLDQSKELVTRILGHLPGTSVHECSALHDLAEASRREDWTSIDALRRWMSLSVSVFCQRVLTKLSLVSSVPPPLTPAPRLWPSLLPSPMLVTGSTWSPVMLSVCTFMTGSFGSVSSTGWACG